MLNHSNESIANIVGQAKNIHPKSLQYWKGRKIGAAFYLGKLTYIFPKYSSDGLEWNDIHDFLQKYGCEFVSHNVAMAQLDKISFITACFCILYRV